MEGFDGLCLIENDADCEDEQKTEELEQHYVPLKREALGYLQDPSHNLSPQIRSNFSTSKVMYHYSRMEYQTAINLSLQYISDPSNANSNKPLLCQFHDVICRSYLELNMIEKALGHCKFLVDSCGHADSDVWMTSAIIQFLLKNSEKGFNDLERCVAMQNANPNIWLLYGTVLAHFHQHLEGKIADISEKLQSCQVHKRFHKRFWDKIFDLCTNECYRYKENAYFFITCSLNNAVRLSHATYDQHNSKIYTSFSTAWSPRVGEILKEILDSSPPEFASSLEKNYTVIHYQNWDDVSWDQIDLVNSFLKSNLPP
ncbi:hypothetical protein ACHWQZ_G013962 [Mnemiopsis leidyi]